MRVAPPWGAARAGLCRARRIAALSFVRPRDRVGPTTGAAMPIIRKSLLQFIFSGTTMKRWNDKLHPVELLEVDKQAHKMMTAWMLFMLNSRDMAPAARRELGDAVVEGGLFDYFTAWSSPTSSRPFSIRSRRTPSTTASSRPGCSTSSSPCCCPWAASSGTASGPAVPAAGRGRGGRAHPRRRPPLRVELGVQPHQGSRPLGRQRPASSSRSSTGCTAFRICAAWMTFWPGRSPCSGASPTCAGNCASRRAGSQTPRIPETSVLGHLFIVAAYAWFLSLSVGACRRAGRTTSSPGCSTTCPRCSPATSFRR